MLSLPRARADCMAPSRDIAGLRFGNLVGIKPTRQYEKSGGWYWIFQCDCGERKEILLSNVTRTTKPTTTCGCKRRVARPNLGSSEKISFIRNGLRRLWLRWPPRYHTRSAARKARGEYTCAGYNRKAHMARNKDINVDHIAPVGEIKDWNEHIEKLFCPAGNLQVLCKDCHKVKTADEREARKNAR